MEHAQNSFISSTHWSERIGPAAALATIRAHKRIDVAKHVQQIGKSVQKGWQRTADDNQISIAVSGLGPLARFSFLDDELKKLKSFFVRKMLEKGFLAAPAFYPMVAHNTRHVDTYLKAVAETFRLMKRKTVISARRPKSNGLASPVYHTEIKGENNEVT